MYGFKNSLQSIERNIPLIPITGPDLVYVGECVRKLLDIVEINHFVLNRTQYVDIELITELHNLNDI